MSAEGQIAGGGVGEPTLDGPLSETQSEQYSLAKILGIWALAAVPMGILGKFLEVRTTKSVLP